MYYTSLYLLSHPSSSHIYNRASSSLSIHPSRHPSLPHKPTKRNKKQSKAQESPKQLITFPHIVS
jgi:hypothetical protein